MVGKLLKWFSAGDDMADSEERSEEMTSGEAGCTLTRFAE